MKQYYKAIFLALAIPVLSNCTSPVDPNEQAINPVTATAVTIAPSTTVTAPAALAAPPPAPEITIYSPYSTDGLLALNEFRSNNTALNDFLIRNRKPDYFFSGVNTEFSYQKIYLVYLESENLYLFDSQIREPYKKFHPLPASIQQKFKGLIPEKSVQQVAPVQNDAESRSAIEKNLGVKKPQPYLDPQLLYSIPAVTDNTPLYPDLYFLDMPLNDLLENEYSAKYDSKKHSLKLIFPKSYDADLLYKKADTQTRKIFVERGINNGKELSLIVPDFLPGSAFYQTTHNNISKVFSSLYQVNVPASFVDSSQLHMRYRIKLCQNDTISNCVARKGSATYVRAIVIEATLYDYGTKIPIETILLK